MNLVQETGPTDPLVHQQNLLLLNYLVNSPDAATFLNKISALMTPGDKVAFFPSSTTSTKFAIIQNVVTYQLVIIIAGMDANYAQAPP